MFLRVGTILIVWIVVELRQAPAQNLVPNPSFESFLANPCNPTFDETYYNFPKYAVNWFLANHGTSDIFGIDIPEGCWASMPLSATLSGGLVPPNGFQLPKDGMRFAGIYTYSHIISPDPSYREYLEVKLDAPLVIGEHYCAEMYVSLAEGPKYASNNLGMLFHEERIDSDDWGGYPHWHSGVSLQDFFVWGGPQILHSEVITDTLEWVRIGGIFQADVAAQYLTIGNYFRDQYTTVVDKTGRFPNGATYLSAYYFVDDVSVEKVGPKSFSFAGTTTICEGDTALIEAKGGLRDIVWTSLSDTTRILGLGRFFQPSPDKTELYRVKGRNCESFVRDTVTVTVLSRPQVDLGEDLSICLGDVVILDSGEGHAGQVWQDNTVNRYLSVRGAGMYFVTVKSNNECLESDTVKVSVKNIPVVDLGPDSLLCNSDFYLLKAGTSNNNYVWSTGATDSVFLPEHPGKYWVKAFNECGIAVDTVNIYSFGDVFIPNVITLNGDDLNSKFEIRGLGGLESPPRVTIFNRWGESILSDSDYLNNWPADEELVSGVYFYTVEFEGCREYKGWIQVLKE